MAEDCEKLSRKAMNKSKEALNIGSSSKKNKKPKEEKKRNENDADMEDEEKVDQESSEDDEPEEVTFEEKVAFTEKVRRLTNDGLTRLVKKVKELCKEALEDVDAEKLHIQGDKIGKDHFGQLSKLVDENLVKTKSGTKRQKTE